MASSDESTIAARRVMTSSGLRGLNSNVSQKCPWAACPPDGLAVPMYWLSFSL
jgi:hypothetical protein